VIITEHLNRRSGGIFYRKESREMIKKDSIRSVVIFIFIIIGVLALGVLDHYTGWEFGFFIFYFIPVALAAWLLGIRYSVIISIISAVVWFISDSYSGHQYSSIFFGYWNAGIRLLTFLSISFSVSYYLLLKKERVLLKELKDALDNEKILWGLIPICARCKKIRDDEGYWKQVEEYIASHTQARFSHGLCPNCYLKYREEAALGDKRSG
jgi:hypothetical protein